MMGFIKSSRGFTLVETLVAFVILAFSLGAIFSIFSNSLQTVRVGAERAHALAVAQSRLAMIDAEEGLDVGVTTGEDESGFQWRADIHDMPDLELAAGDTDMGLVEVVVTVSWGVARQRSVELTTLRLVQP